MSEPLDPYGYGTSMMTMAEIEAKTTVNKLHPELWRRFKALIESAHTQVARGVVTGGGCNRIRPHPGSPHPATPGMNPARATRRRRRVRDRHRPHRSWHWMEANCADYGIRTFNDVNSEPWHVQPCDIPASATIAPPWNLPVWPLPDDQPEPRRPPSRRTTCLHRS